MLQFPILCHFGKVNIRMNITIPHIVANKPRESTPFSPIDFRT